MGRACVEDNCEILGRGCADKDLSEVSCLVRDNFILPENWYILFVQLNYYGWFCFSENGIAEKGEQDESQHWHLGSSVSGGMKWFDDPEGRESET